MTKPRLTAKVIRGLGSLVVLCEAGAPEDTMGADYDMMTPDEKGQWADIERACEWYWQMRHYRASRGQDDPG